MRRLLVRTAAAAALPLFFASVAALGQSYNRRLEPSGLTKDLQLAASIISQETCVLTERMDALRLTIQLRYTNVGREKLILYKGNRLFFQVRVSRAGDDVDASAASNELRATHSRYFDEQPEKIETDGPGSVFNTLSPGASYEARQVISIPVAREAEAVQNVSIGAGEHDLSLVASTWYESGKLAMDLRKRWRSRGLLWTDPLASNSITFTVGPKRASAVCR